MNNVKAADLRKRLLLDIAELKTQPYPNIYIHVDDANLTEICLVLTPEDWRPLHLTVSFHDQYPLTAPTIRMDSTVQHPNVFGSYICASILNTDEGYTPAYTLKGIAIQMLSFFGSDSIEQEYGGKVSLRSYRDTSSYQFASDPTCHKCGFNPANASSSQARLYDFIITPGFEHSQAARRSIGRNTRDTTNSTALSPARRIDRERFFISRLPNELLLQIGDYLDFEHLTKFAQSWSRMSRLITEYDVVRVRELQCFVLKESYMRRMLGVGVSLTGWGRQRTLQSEFDLLSESAYTLHGVRESIQGIEFEHWLPLPISYGHWHRANAKVDAALVQIAKDARIGSANMVLYAFMNDIIVRLNTDLESREAQDDRTAHKSTLRHASEKAIESYFHLFHLLLCLATSKPAIVSEANRIIRSFMSGKTGKAHVPNLGYLLIALLISDIDPTEALMKQIVTEAVTRNVVWLLDRKGAGMAELGYLESDRISEYRLRKTFEGSRTSYRLLMFSELFRRTARPSPAKAALTDAPAATPPQTLSYSTAMAAGGQSSPATTPPRGKKTLAQLRDELFRRHGGPPPGAAAFLAGEVRRLQQINDFPHFLQEMGITIPSASVFTRVLRDTVKASATKGYSRPAETYFRSLASLRLHRDPTVDRETVTAELARRRLEPLPAWKAEEKAREGAFNFFPVSLPVAGAAVSRHQQARRTRGHAMGVRAR